MPDQPRQPDPGPWTDQLCDRLEAGWQAGSPEPVESLLPLAPAVVRPDVFVELFKLDREYRSKSGRPLGRAEALQRFGPLGSWAANTVEREMPAPCKLIVEVLTGPYVAQAFELSGPDTYSFGRQPGLSVSLPKDTYVSRVHAMIAVMGSDVRVLDLGSKHGTHVDGKQVSEAVVPSGATVWLGPKTSLRLRLDSAVFDATLTAAGRSTAQHAGPDRPPVIPGYTIGEELGRGNMGVVFRGVREADGETVAVKTILPATTLNRATVGRFCRESEILGQLDHPNIVGYCDSGAAGGLLYVVMKYIPGTTGTRIVLREGPLTRERALSWADQLLAALAHAHSLGFVHRDVKPGNLLVAPEAGGDRVFLSDFGLARAYEQSGWSGLTDEHSSGGTPAFMPPEQVTDFRSVGPRADQYAAAATFYYLLTGRHIYAPQKSMYDLLKQILNHDPVLEGPQTPEIPEAFSRVIRRGLARSPGDRYPDVTAMRADLLRR